MILLKLKGFSFDKENVTEVVVRIGSSLHFHGEGDLYLSFLREKKRDRVHEHFDLVEVIT